MSLDYCDWCKCQIDTDKDTECYWEDMCACENCRERMQLQAERMAEENEAQSAQINDEERA